MKIFITIVISLIFSSSLWAAEHPLEHLISVSGDCLRSVSHDRASITLTAESLNKDMKVASQEASTTYEKVREAIKRLDLKNAEFQTTEFSVQEQREWEKNSSVFKGYKAKMGLVISTSDLKRLGDVISIAAKN